MKGLWSERMATEMAMFFSGPGTLGHFLARHDNLELREAVSLAQRLVQENIIEFCVCWDSGPGEGSSYRTYNLPPQDELDYGVIDCLVFGFPYIRSRFEKSIIPLLAGGQLGTAFLIDGHRILTARHCLVNSSDRAVSLKLKGVQPECVSRMVVPCDDRRDVGVLTLDGEPKLGGTPFRIGTASVLDEVMALGYPSIPGFDNLLVAQTARVAGHLHSTTGEIVERATSYIDKVESLLISARVKGGSSGGPVVNKRGEVVGMVSGLPADSADVDKLGFGIAMSSEEIRRFLAETDSASDEVRDLRSSLTPWNEKL